MTTNPTFCVSFILRISKTKPEQSTIYARVAVNGKRTEFSIIKNVPTNSWQSKKETLNHSYKEFRKANAYIDQVRSQLTAIYRELTLSKELATPSIIKNHFFGNSSEVQTLSYLIEYHTKTQSQVLSSGTLAHYRTTEKYLREFLLSYKKTSDIYLTQIDYQLITEFESYLRLYKPTDHHKPMSHNVVMKHLTRLRKMVNLAIKLDWITKNPFDRFTVTYKKVDRGYLREQELQLIMDKEFSIERLSFVRDLFVFSCYTGLSYVDVYNLEQDNIVLGIDGEKWIFTKRQKTDITLQIPLLPIAAEIVNKYKNNYKALNTNKIFPLISNQKVNSYLKEIADICGINKNLTFHLARHTFATTVTLGNGVPIETVSKILGHTKISTTQVYARVLQNKISDDMSKLKNKLNGKEDNLPHKKSSKA